MCHQRLECLEKLLSLYPYPASFADTHYTSKQQHTTSTSKSTCDDAHTHMTSIQSLIAMLGQKGNGDEWRSVPVKYERKTPQSE